MAKELRINHRLSCYHMKTSLDDDSSEALYISVVEMTCLGCSLGKRLGLKRARAQGYFYLCVPEKERRQLHGKP